jgi:hypothetical protein
MFWPIALGQYLIHTRGRRGWAMIALLYSALLLPTLVSVPPRTECEGGGATRRPSLGAAVERFDHVGGSLHQLDQHALATDR